MAKRIDSAMNLAQRGARALGASVGDLRLSYQAGVIQGRLESLQNADRILESLRGTAKAERPLLSEEDRAVLQSILDDDPKKRFTR